LRSDDAAVPQGIVHQLEVRLLEQALSRALWVRRVGDDDVEAVLVVVQELEAVADVDLDLGVVVTRSHAGKVLLGEANDGLQTHVSDMLSRETCGCFGVIDLVNVTQDCLLNALMLDNFTENTTVTAANDQDLLGVGVGVHGQVGDHLLVGKLVPLSALDDIVQDQDGAVVGRLKDQDVLVLALLVVQNLLDLQGHGLA